MVAALKQRACWSLVSGALFEHNLSGTADNFPSQSFLWGGFFNLRSDTNEQTEN